MNTDLIDDINKALEVELPARISDQELKERLTAYVNHLINHDFEKLVSVLYRIDVNENKMRKLLEQKEGEDAAGLIANLIIERQLQKIKSRQETKKNNEIPDDEKW
jgi:uncharacterized protein YwgA